MQCCQANVLVLGNNNDGAPVIYRPHGHYTGAHLHHYRRCLLPEKPPLQGWAHGQEVRGQDDS